MKKENLCPAPWTSIYVDPIGRVDNCCVSKNNLGNLQQLTLDELVNSPRNRAIKKMMEFNLQPSGCSACHNKTNSFKQVMHKRFENVHNENFYENVNNFELNYADLRFRNTCNYACIYCGPVLSSLWASELELKIKSNENNLTEIKTFFENRADTLKEVYLAGGEPLLIKENEFLLDVLIKKNPKITVYVNTNLSTINNKIFELLMKFENVVWIVSVDDINDRYNYIRWPGDWDNFLSNLLLLKNNKPENHSITFTMVYSIVNCKTIFSCIEYLNSIGFNNSHYKMMYVSNKIALDPRQFNIQIINELKQYLFIKISDILNSGMKEKESLVKDLEDIISMLGRPLPNLDKQKSIDFFKTLDNKRKLDSKLVFPEMHSLLNNI